MLILPSGVGLLEFMIHKGSEAILLLGVMLSKE